MDDQDARHLRRAFALASQARDAGHRPFGAVLVAGGDEIAEGGSTQTAQGDPTAHAEMNVVRRAAHILPRNRLAGATLYASSEPCAMCAAAIFYNGIGRIVFGLSERQLRDMRNTTAHGAGLAMSCRDVLARAHRPTVIVGPCLEDEAMAAHEGYWNAPV